MHADSVPDAPAHCEPARPGSLHYRRGVSNRQVRSDLGRLVGVISGTVCSTDLAVLTRSHAEALCDLSRRHGVEPWLAATAPAADAGAASAAWERQREQHARFAASVARDRRELRGFAAIADALGARWVVLKGVGLAEDVYPRPDLRHGVDIDVLVEPRAFEAVVSALIGAGWTQSDRNWPLIERAELGELSIQSPSGGRFDVHWHVVNDRTQRRAVDLATEGLLDGTRTLPSGLPVLSRHDQLMHVALHASMAGANRLQWLLDVHLAAAAVTDWPAFAARARSARVGVPVSVALLRARRWFGTPVPAPSLELMGATRLWQRTCAVVDSLSPLAGDPVAGSLARSFARSARPSVRSSFVELAGHGSAFVRHGARRATEFSVIHDAADPRSTRYAAPDDRARARYFAALAPARPISQTSSEASSTAEL